MILVPGKRNAIGVAVALLLALAASPSDAARYAMKRDPASRYDFRHVFERDSKLWVHLHCELRVPLARRLPTSPPSRREGRELEGSKDGEGIERASKEAKERLPSGFRRNRRSKDLSKGRRIFDPCLNVPSSFDSLD